MTDDDREREIERLEIEALERLCGKFNAGSPEVATTLFEQEPYTQHAKTLWARMCGLGAIREVSAAIIHTRFVLSEDIVAITDRRKAEIAARHRPPDRVAAAEEWIRSHKFLSLGREAEATADVLYAAVEKLGTNSGTIRRETIKN